MAHDLIGRIERIGSPRLLVVGDLILDRYVWGDVERISPEAPVPIFRADGREHRPGGAASVAAMARALGADVVLVGGVGRDAEGDEVRGLLASLGIDDRHVLTLDDRPTTLKERYIGRAQGRHPQPMMRVDRESREPASSSAEADWSRRLAVEIDRADVVLVADYGKGACTPRLLRGLFGCCRRAGIRAVVDPVRTADPSLYLGAHAMTPNRPEAQAAAGMTIRSPEDALAAGRVLLDRLGLEAALVTLDRDGMALARRDGPGELIAARPRDVYDITGAGDMVLAVLGACLADGADYSEAAALANVAGGLEVERIGVVPLTRGEILRDLIEHDRADPAKRPDRAAVLAEARRRKAAGQTVVFTNGCFDLLHVGHARLLSEAAALGDYLVVGLNSDASVRELKGPARPINGEEARAEMLQALGAVDAVVIFDEETPLALIEAVRPDVLVKGADYRPDQVVGREVVERDGGRVVLIPLVDGCSTTGLLRRAKDGRPAGGRDALDAASLEGSHAHRP